MTRYVMKFFGSDGEFEYTYGTGGDAFWYFRNPRVFGLTWTFDGDGWSSEETLFIEPGKSGRWYIGLEA